MGITPLKVDGSDLVNLLCSYNELLACIWCLPKDGIGAIQVGLNGITLYIHYVNPS